MDEYLFKVVVVGNQGVGKTCLLLQYCDNTFQENYKVTIGVDFRLRNIERPGFLIRMQIWDTGGMDRFRTVLPSFYRGAVGIIVAYDVTDRSSFDKVTSWLDESRMYAHESCVGLLVGTKIDEEWKRKVTTEQGKALANNLGLHFFETSAKNRKNVTETFDALADAILARKRSEDGATSLLSGPSSLGSISLHGNDMEATPYCSGDLYSCTAM